MIPRLQMTHPSNVETDNPTPTLALLSHNALLAVGTRSSKVAKNIRMTIHTHVIIENPHLTFGHGRLKMVL